MIKPPTQFLTIIFASSLLIFADSASAARQTFVTIGTGGATGVYYPTGGAICRLLNQGKNEHGIRCNVQSTGGSEYNVNMMSAGELDFGIVQSDVGFKAWNGQPPFKEKIKNLRSVFSIYSETQTLVALKSSGIQTLHDIKGKRVNIGNPGSGQLRTTLELMSACGISKTSLALAGSLKAAEMPDALRDRKLDAYFYVVGHPTANIMDISTSADIALVEISGPCVDSLISAHPYYVHASIPGKLYRGVDEPVPTFGLTATLLTTADVSDAVVYETVKAIFDHLDEFKKLHPAYRDLDPAHIQRGLAAPLHPGAEKYFREKNLL